MIVVKVVSAIGGDTWRAVKNWQVIHACFNPRPRVGGDLLASCKQPWYRSFNPRPRVDMAVLSARAHHAVSVRRAARGDSRSCFNPRPRVGGDLSLGHVSIHAPA